MSINQLHPRTRKGKTRKDKRSGAYARCTTNKLARADWQNNHEHKDGLRDFPWASCNGKRNRYHIVLRGQGQHRNPLYKHATHK